MNKPPSVCSTKKSCFTFHLQNPLFSLQPFCVDHQRTPSPPDDQWEYYTQLHFSKHRAMLIFEHPALSLMVRVNKTKGNPIVKVERNTNPDGMTTLFPLLRDAKKKEESKKKKEYKLGAGRLSDSHILMSNKSFPFSGT